MNTDWALEDGQEKHSPWHQELACCYQLCLAAVMIFRSLSLWPPKFLLGQLSCQLLIGQLFPEMPGTGKFPRQYQRAPCACWDTPAMPICTGDNSPLAFTSFLHKISRSARGERLGSSWVFPGHEHSTVHASGPLDLQGYVSTFQRHLWTSHPPAFPFKLSGQPAVFPSCCHRLR